MLDGAPLPKILYGTAWKEKRTEALTALALRSGFHGIDTANQRKHYFEAAVGRALQGAIAAGQVTRGELFVQTKFTFRGGQDQRLPYDPKAPITTQVEQSLTSSLEHFSTTYVDSFVLHGPSGRGRLSALDIEARRAIEAQVGAGRTRFVGVVYQGFSLLTANRAELAAPAVAALVQRTGRSAAELVFRFAHSVGIMPLTGTSSEPRMRLDLEAIERPIEPG